MTKRQLIDEIITLNQTAKPAFLARFQDEDLGEYLQHLLGARKPRLTGDASRYSRFFATGESVDSVETSKPPTEEDAAEPELASPPVSPRVEALPETVEALSEPALEEPEPTEEPAEEAPQYIQAMPAQPVLVEVEGTYESLDESYDDELSDEAEPGLTELASALADTDSSEPVTVGVAGQDASKDGNDSWLF